MKKITISCIALMLAALIFVLSGCELSVDLNEDETTTTTLKQPDTAVVEITNKEGAVVETQTVTMSAKDKEDSENFFNTVDKKPQSGISQDRLNDALKTETTATGKPDAVKPTKHNKPNVTSKPNGNTGSVGDDSFLDDMNNTTQAVVLDDGEILRSNQYVTNVRLDVKGEVTTYKIAQRGKRSSFTFSYEGQNIGLIVTESYIYLLSIDTKEYVEFPRELLEENASPEDLAMLDKNLFNFDRKVKKTSTEKADGITYKVITYEDGVKDYYVGKKIIKTVDGDTVMYFDSVSAVAPSTLFTPPKSYKKTKYEDISLPETTVHTHSDEK